jgi:hypothetical protein
MGPPNGNRCAAQRDQPCGNPVLDQAVGFSVVLAEQTPVSFLITA